MRGSSSNIFSAALALAGLLTACDSGQRPSSLPLPATGLLELVGPSSVPPGGTAQFTLIEHVAGGVKRDVTGEAVWSSSMSSVLSFTSPGLAAGRQIGDAHIYAMLSNGRTSTKEVIVVPPGTYRLTGRVTEADVPTLPIANARVGVTAGPAAGLFTTTTNDGDYRLYGLSGETQVQLAKDGYQPQVQSLVVLDHQTQNFQLTLLRPRADLSGSYILTITAAPRCQAALPDEATRRTYSAVVTQQGPQLEVKLSGATFVLFPDGRGDGFRGRVDPDGVTFSLRQYDAYYEPYADLAEQLAPSRYLMVDGTVRVMVSTAQLTGNLNGSLHVFDRNPRDRAVPIAQCRATDHQFALSR